MARVAQELAENVQTWLERAADHVLDRLQPPEAGLAYEGGILRDARSDIGDQRKDIRQDRFPTEPG